MLTTILCDRVRLNRAAWSLARWVRVSRSAIPMLALVIAMLACAGARGQVVISQVYGGGGNASAQYTNDFVELFNRGPYAQSLNGWSLQYTSANGTSWGSQLLSLPNVILQPGQYFLIQLGSGGSIGVALPSADASGNINMSASAGKVLISNTTTAQTVAAPTGSAIIDIVSYGSADATEGAPTSALSNTTAAIRNSAGCTDTNVNSADFTIAVPTPRNSATTRSLCPVSDTTQFGAVPNGTIATNEYGTGSPTTGFRWTGGGNSFGNPLSSGSIFLKSDPANLYVSYRLGATLNNYVVVLLDTATGGFTPNVTGAGGDERAVSRMLNNTTLPSGFGAEFAIVFGGANGGSGNRVYTLSSGAITASTFFQSSGTGNASGDVREIRIPYAVLGIAPGATVRFVAGLNDPINNTPAFLSNESIPSSPVFNAATQPGNTGAATFSQAGTFVTSSFTPTLVTTRTDTTLTAPTVDGTLGSNEYGPGNTFSYTGGGTGFGGTVGGGTLYMKSSGSTLYIGFQAGAALNDIAVLYLRTTTGGYTDGTMGDLTTTDRAVISDLTRDPDDGFPILANYAISIWNPGSGTAGAFPYQLQPVGSNHTFIPGYTFAIGAGGLGGTGFREIAIPLSSLGISPGASIDFFMAYCSSTRTNSNESIPPYATLNTAANPAQVGPSPGYATFNRFVTSVCTVASITTQPGATAIQCNGSTTSISVVAAGTSLTYQWQQSTDGGVNWGNASGTGATTATLTTAINAVDGTRFRVLVTAACGSTVTSNTTTLTVQPNTAITTQPIASLTQCSGTTTNISVVATGPGLTYQWQQSTNGGLNYVNAAGANTTTATMTTLGTAVNGTLFRCVVTGTCGTVTSDAATLTVPPNTAITGQPSSIAQQCFGVTTNIAVTAVGANLTYQWQQSTDGGQSYSNAQGTNTTTATMTTLASAANLTQFRCIVTGTCGTVTSNTSTLFVNPLTAITTQPAATAAQCSGLTTTISLVAAGTNLTYQWQQSINGGLSYTNAQGTNTTSATLTTSASAVDGTLFRCVVTGDCGGSVTSNVVTLTVNPNTAITTQPPSSVSRCSNETTTISVVATGASLTYQWQQSTDGGQSYSNAQGTNTTSATMTTTVTSLDQTLFRCVVTGICGTLTSSVATLTVTPVTTITQQPTPSALQCGGAAPTLVVVATGSNLSYLWEQSINGGATWLPAAGVNTQASYTTQVAALDQTLFRCVITGTCGTVTSSVVTLTVVPGTLAITSQPPGTINACVGSSPTVSVSTTGTNVLYQWQVSVDSGATWNNAPGVSATSATYAFGVIAEASNGLRYRVIVSNLCGSITSSVVTLNVTTTTIVTLNVQLEGASPGPFDRCLTIDLYTTGSCPNPAVSLQQVVTFTDGVGTTVVSGIPCGTYSGISVRDSQHTLRRSAISTPVFDTSDPNNLIATFSDSTNKTLLGGNVNDDEFIDILDFGGYIGAYGQNVGASTSCPTSTLHADFDGGGLVDTADFTFIQSNFLRVRESDPCGNALLAQPVTSISVRELVAKGMWDVARGDLNRDGMLNTLDATFAARNGISKCPANYNGLGGVDVQDIFDFLSGWINLQPATDANRDGTLSVSDIFAFLASWFRGC